MTASPSRLEVARSVARMLFDTGCVQIRGDEPFRLPSGWASPVYMDCRKLISYPAIRRQLVAQSLELLRERGVTGLDSVAGAETSGIALAAAGTPVKDAFVIFDYGVFPTAELLAPFGVTVHSLANWRDMREVGRENGRFAGAALAELDEFLRDPVAWSRAHGGIPSVSTSH